MIDPKYETVEFQTCLHSVKDEAGSLNQKT